MLVHGVPRRGWAAQFLFVAVSEDRECDARTMRPCITCCFVCRCCSGGRLRSGIRSRRRTGSSPWIWPNDDLVLRLSKIRVDLDGGSPALAPDRRRNRRPTRALAPSSVRPWQHRCHCSSRDPSLDSRPPANLLHLSTSPPPDLRGCSARGDRLRRPRASIALRAFLDDAAFRDRLDDWLERLDDASCGEDVLEPGSLRHLFFAASRGSMSPFSSAALSSRDHCDWGPSPGEPLDLGALSLVFDPPLTSPRHLLPPRLLFRPALVWDALLVFSLESLPHLPSAPAHPAHPTVQPPTKGIERKHDRDPDSIDMEKEVPQRIAARPLLGLLPASVDQHGAPVVAQQRGRDALAVAQVCRREGVRLAHDVPGGAVVEHLASAGRIQPGLVDARTEGQ